MEGGEKGVASGRRGKDEMGKREGAGEGGRRDSLGVEGGEKGVASGRRGKDLLDEELDDTLRFRRHRLLAAGHSRSPS